MDPILEKAEWNEIQGRSNSKDLKRNGHSKPATGRFQGTRSAILIRTKLSSITNLTFPMRFWIPECITQLPAGRRKPLSVNRLRGRLPSGVYTRAF